MSVVDSRKADVPRNRYYVNNIKCLAYLIVYLSITLLRIKQSEESFVCLPLGDKHNLNTTQEQPLTVFPKPLLLIKCYQKPPYKFPILHKELNT